MTTAIKDSFVYTPIPKETLEKTAKIACEFFGEKIQLVIAMEELAELQQALSKKYRGENNKRNATSEVGDVIVCLWQIMEIYDMEYGDIYQAIMSKCKRLNMKIGEMQESG